MTRTFAEWKPYTNPRTQKSGWISAGGAVRYDKPKDSAKPKGDPSRPATSTEKASAREAVNATAGNGNKIGPEHVEAFAAHLETLTRNEKRELARSIGAHVGGLHSELTARLLAYAQGKPQPPYPKKPRAETLLAMVQHYGGIDPGSHELKGTYKNMREAIQDGVNLGAFRKGGRGLDVLAEEMVSDGYLTVPSGKKPGEHLLEQLKEGAASRHQDLTADYDKQYAEYLQAMQEAEADAGTGKSEIKKAVRSAAKAGKQRGGAKGKREPANAPLAHEVGNPIDFRDAE